MDPGLTAALAIGLAQYVLVAAGVCRRNAAIAKTIAIAAIARVWRRELIAASVPARA